MSSKQGDLYHRFFTSFKCASSHVSVQEAQKQANVEWKEAKQTISDKLKFTKFIEQKIEYYNVQSTKKKVTLMNYFLKSSSSVEGAEESQPIDANSDNIVALGNPMDMTEESTEESTEKQQEILQRVYRKPAQEKLSRQVQILETQLNSKIFARNSDLGGDTSQFNIFKTKKKLTKLKQKLKTKKLNAHHQQNFRAKLKEKITQLAVATESTVPVVGIRETVGRPRLEEKQPELLKIIAEIALFGSAAHDRRRAEDIKSCRTLDDLHKELNEMGISISRSATYLRLLPKNFTTHEGKRHVTTAPVRLCRAQTESHKAHPDSHFCTTTIRYLESLASFLGFKQVGFISQDDKARVPIGLTAAHKQSPLLMHVQVRVKLPDHDWVIAERHKLIPSVYAGIFIKSGGIGSPDAVTYSGPTYIAIRSGKHSSSTAATHSDDFHRLMELDCFNDILKSGDTVKPVLIFTVDGGPDENPRYHKVIGFGIEHFKKYNLDALYIATNAPGRSAFNRVERRMAPLSRQLAGLILPHDAYGNHLNESGKTIDVELERINFAKAGETLASLWSELVVDGYQVTAEYREPGGESALPLEVDASWYQKHVRESQYLLQVAKCGEEECCGPMRSNLSLILPNRFLPPPCRLKQNDQTGQLSILVSHNAGEEARFLPFFQRLSITMPRGKWNKMPYDASCPTVQSQLESRVCSQCELYFASKKALNSHVKSVHKSAKVRLAPKCRPKRVVAKRKQELLCIIEDGDTKEEDIEWRDTGDVHFELEDVQTLHVATENAESGLPIIDSVEEWITNPWTSEDWL